MTGLRPVPTPVAPREAAPAPPGLVVTCAGVGAVYDGGRGTTQALAGVDLELRGHEFVSLVGPSGCGKSTLLRIIGGLRQPSVGEVTWHPARPSLGLVFQEFGTFPWMTVAENLAFGLEMRGVPKPVREARAREYADRLGLGAFADAYPRELSVGMRQRVDIGRAFVADTRMLLMDEPFGALDVQTRWVLQDELLRAWQADRKLVLFVTHDLDEAVLLSDRVLVMTGRPGTICAEVPVSLPRPRDARRDHVAVRELAWHIWDLLEPEVRTGLAVRG